MVITFEKNRNSFCINVDKSFEFVTLADLENLRQHLDYFINNEKVDSLSIKIGDEEDGME